MTVHFSGDVSGDSIPERGELGRSDFCKKSFFGSLKYSLFSRKMWEFIKFLNTENKTFFVKKSIIFFTYQSKMKKYVFGIFLKIFYFSQNLEIYEKI